MQSRVPATPLPLLFKAPFSGWFFPYAYMRRQQVSQQVGKQGNRINSQPAVFFPWQRHQPANTRTLRSWLFAAVATAGVSRQQAPAPAQPTPALLWKRLLWRNPHGGIQQFTAAQLRRLQAGAGAWREISFTSVALLPLAASATSISYLLSLTWSPLLSSTPPLPLYFISVTIHTHSLSHHIPTHPTLLSHSPK